MTFKIGDRVRVKSFDEIRKTLYDEGFDVEMGGHEQVNTGLNISFTWEMLKYCNKDYLVIDYEDDNDGLCYQLHCGDDWFFVPEWIEPFHKPLPEELFEI